ncbi:MAG: BrnT family toxin [Pyrinomonadaceae bacterium]
MNGTSEKLKAIFRKHKIIFERAAAIFRDPNLLSIPDEEHSKSEERWLTMGLDETGILLVISHTFKHSSAKVCKHKNYLGAKSSRSGRKTI